MNYRQRHNDFDDFVDIYTILYDSRWNVDEQDRWFNEWQRAFVLLKQSSDEANFLNEGSSLTPTQPFLTFRRSAIIYRTNSLLAFFPFLPLFSSFCFLSPSNFNKCLDGFVPICSDGNCFLRLQRVGKIGLLNKYLMKWIPVRGCQSLTCQILCSSFKFLFNSQIFSLASVTFRNKNSCESAWMIELHSFYTPP